MGQKRLHIPRHWRACADETLTIATPSASRLLIDVAQTYARLARLAAAEAHPEALEDVRVGLALWAVEGADWGHSVHWLGD